MKTTTMPALRANPKLRQAQEKFIARGLNAQKQAKQNNKYYAADQILAMLDDMLDKKKSLFPSALMDMLPYLK